MVKRKASPSIRKAPIAKGIGGVKPSPMLDLQRAGFRFKLDTVGSALLRRPVWTATAAPDAIRGIVTFDGDGRLQRMVTPNLGAEGSSGRWTLRHFGPDNDGETIPWGHRYSDPMAYKGEVDDMVRFLLEYPLPERIVVYKTATKRRGDFKPTPVLKQTVRASPLRAKRRATRSRRKSSPLPYRP
jgi:hypothetical protein